MSDVIIVPTNITRIIKFYVPGPAYTLLVNAHPNPHSLIVYISNEQFQNWNKNDLKVLILCTVTIYY